MNSRLRNRMKRKARRKRHAGVVVRRGGLLAYLQNKKNWPPEDAVLTEDEKGFNVFIDGLFEGKP